MFNHVVQINSRGSVFELFNLGELIKYKDLFVEFVSRDIKMRHKQTILGAAWVVFQPIVSTVIFTVIFGLILKVPSNNLPYPIFVFVALNFWNFFSSSITAASGSLIGNESLIKKVYFPRIIIPIAAIATNLFDFVISSFFLFLILFAYKIIPSISVFLILPLLVLLVLISCLGIGLFLSALNVRYRDVKQILPFFIQILIFLTPVFYPVTMVSEQNRWILSLNPLTTAIEILRGLLVGVVDVGFIEIAISSSVAIFLLFVGLVYFKKTEKYFADVI